MKPILPVAIIGAAILAGGVLLAGNFGDRSNSTPAAPVVEATGNVAIPATGTVRAVSLRTVNLKVENMSCVSCPIIVRRALEKVEGVSRVEISFRSKTATVSFDPTRSDVAKLTAATKAHGYPSSVIR